MKLRHYEMIFLGRTYQDTQFDSTIERYKTLIKESGGGVHRFEDWGKRALAYPIQKNTKARYILMNIETNPETVIKIKTLASTNEAILRHLIVNKDEAIVADSPLKFATDKNDKNNKHKKYDKDKKDYNKSKEVKENKEAKEAKEGAEAKENAEVKEDKAVETENNK